MMYHLPDARGLLQEVRICNIKLKSILYIYIGFLDLSQPLGYCNEKVDLNTWSCQNNFKVDDVLDHSHYR